VLDQVTKMPKGYTDSPFWIEWKFKMRNDGV
jgi:hypothetical protein